jgi:hypothetical protein
MKKILVAAFAIAVAGIVQAANYNWSSSGTIYTYDSTEAAGWPVVAADTTAYFVFASAYSQSDLVADFAAGTVDYTALSAAGNGKVNGSGQISTTAASGDYTTPQQTYFVVFQDAQNMFISGSVTAAYDALTAPNVVFKADQVDNVWTGTSLDAADGYAGAGWYSAAAVPEPTSGLLLLLGVAGLALRRKQA